ncbi:MAG: hypothetical protein ACD_23C00192G0001 [uncultured bacterium]|nr:MAG: hypothetical protein ACD_23C00192G0001 [uncultured bacterium]
MARLTRYSPLGSLIPKPSASNSYKPALVSVERGLSSTARSSASGVSSFHTAQNLAGVATVAYFASFLFTPMTICA